MPPAHKSKTEAAPAQQEAMSSVMDQGAVPATLQADYEIAMKHLSNEKHPADAPLHVRVKSLIEQREDLINKLSLRIGEVQKLESELKLHIAHAPQQQQQRQRHQGSRSDRVEFVTTGAIQLSDGTRLCLRHIVSYRAGGTESILFYGEDTVRPIGTWQPPKELDGPANEKKRQEARTEALEGLDRIFAVDR